MKMDVTKSERVKKITGPVYWVEIVGGGIKNAYLETNADRGIGHGPEEAVVRVFTRKSDVGRYAETVAEYQMVNPTQVNVVETNIETVFKELRTVAFNLRKKYRAAVRVDLSEMPPDQHPRTVEVLYSEFRTRN
jgi:hypothetical protein